MGFGVSDLSLNDAIYSMYDSRCIFSRYYPGILLVCAVIVALAVQRRVSHVSFFTRALVEASSFSTLLRTSIADIEITYLNGVFALEG